MATRDECEVDQGLLSALQKLDGLHLPDSITSIHNLDADTLTLIVALALDHVTGSEIQV